MNVANLTIASVSATQVSFSVLYHLTTSKAGVTEVVEQYQHNSTTEINDNDYEDIPFRNPAFQFRLL